MGGGSLNLKKRGEIEFIGTMWDPENIPNFHTLFMQLHLKGVIAPNAPQFSTLLSRWENKLEGWFIGKNFWPSLLFVG